jgi:hypothetical protein
MTLTRKFALIAATVITVSCAVAYAASSLSAPPHGSRSTNAGPSNISVDEALVLGDIKEVSYMPPDAGWSLTWLRWKPTEIASGYREIANLGANTVRVVIPTFVFGYPSPSRVMSARLRRVMRLAAADDLHVDLVLFDEFGNYAQVAHSEQFVHQLLAPYSNDPQIAFVELQNEINPTDSAAMSWAGVLLPYLKSVVGRIPVTISTPGSLGVGGLQLLQEALGRVQPDFYDLHYYGSAGDALTTFAAAQKLALPRPLFIGEAGWSTTPLGDDPSPTPVALSEQAEFFFSVEAAAARLHLPPAAPWTMFDLLPSGLPWPMSQDQRYFGLFSTAGAAKPAASVVRSYFHGASEPLIDNRTFAMVSDGIPVGWAPVNAATATMSLSRTVSLLGHASVSIGGATGPGSFPAAWSTVPNLGLLTPGETFRASAWAKGLDATGTTQIALAWFNYANQYIGNSVSPALAPGTTGWAHLVCSASAPDGAAYAELSLQSYGNAGTVWFAGVNLYSPA